MVRHLLILDLDETLIYGTEHPLEREADFVTAGIHVYRRPFLSAFLDAAFIWFDVAVWTNASRPYAESIVRTILSEGQTLRFLWSSDRATMRYDPVHLERRPLKDLKKVRRAGYNLEQVLVIDDTASNFSRHYGNHIRVGEYTGDLSDTEVRDIIPLLQRLRTIENVRPVEKRGWRTTGPA